MITVFLLAMNPFRLRIFATLIMLAGAHSASAEARSDMGSVPYRWRNVEITGGGFVTGIISHPGEPNLRYARTDVGGAYRWSEQQTRWVAITDWISQKDWTLAGIESLALDPTNPDRVYMAAGSYTNDWSGNGAILRSEDRGKTWQRTPMPFKFGGNEPGRSNGERLAVDPRSPQTLYLGTRRNGLWKSSDRGANWELLKSFPDPGETHGAGIVGVTFSPESGDVWVAVSNVENAIWRSADAGASWSSVPGQPKGQVPHQARFGPDGSLYVTYSNIAGPNDITDGSVWKFQPREGTWKEISPLRPSTDDRFGYSGLGIDAKKPGVLLVSTICRWARHDDLFRSIDGGITWTQIGPKANHDEGNAAFLRWGRPKVDLGHWIGDVEIDPFASNKAWYITGMTIWGTENLTDADSGKGTNWKMMAQGVEETVINELASPASGAPLLSAMWDIGGFRHENLTVSPVSGFYQPFHGHNTGLDYAELKPDIVVRVFSKGGAWSKDNARTWVDFPAPEGTAGNGSVAVSADGASWVWSPDRSTPHVSLDAGKSWTPCDGLSAGVVVRSERVLPQYFYGFNRSTGQIFRSSDGGSKFVPVGEAPARDGEVKAMPGRRGHLWWISHNGLFRSVNGGKSWARASGNLINEGRRIAFGRPVKTGAYPTLYLAGTVSGVSGLFRSVDEAGAWVRIHEESQQFHSVRALAGDSRIFGRVYVGTSGRGIYYGEPDN